MEPTLSLEGAVDQEWHAVPTVFDSKRRLFVAWCIPIRLGKFEFTGGWSALHTGLPLPTTCRPLAWCCICVVLC